jgi:hypothetical protein
MTDDELITAGRALLLNFDAWARDYRSKPSPGTYAYWIDALGKLREWLTDHDFANARRLLALAEQTAAIERAAGERE